jgi:DNA modification methylase
LVGDVLDGLRTLDAGSVQCCVTSPPYWGLRDYGVDGQIGLEPTPEAFVAKMVEVFREVRRVLREDGVCFLNIGDSYATGTTANRQQSPNPGVGANCPEAQNSVARIGTPAGLKTKDLCGIPWRVVLALQADGWYWRSCIVWAKKSPMPESVTDRPTSSWEPIFLLAKGERYFYDAEAVKEQTTEASGWAKQRAKGEDTWKYNDTEERIAATGGNNKGTPGTFGTRNQRNVWHLGPEPYAEAHFATFPTEIPRRAILAGTSEKGACPKCGAPWARVVERTPMGKELSERTATKHAAGLATACGGAMTSPPSSRTTGWQPTCRCGNPNTVPCVILDPFLGSGTTIAVARTLGRHGVGCELNPAYAALARDRIGRAEKPSTYVAEKADDSPLFAGDSK